MRTLVISSGTVEKRDQVPDPALAAELLDPARRRLAEERLAAFACPAVAMYTGTQHRLVMEALWSVWERWGRGMLDLALLSAGYGLIPAEELIVPYEVAFEDLAPLLGEWSARQAVRERASVLVSEYDLAFYLLSGPALTALRLPLDVPASVEQFVLTDAGSIESVPAAPNVHAFVAAKNRAAQRWHVKAPEVCGFLFGRLCEQIVRYGPAILEWLHDQPQDLDQLFYKRPRWKPQLRLWAKA
jgi:hypothetical protein